MSDHLLTGIVLVAVADAASVDAVPAVAYVVIVFVSIVADAVLLVFHG